MIKAVIFDFGQTLVNSADGFRLAEKEAKQKIFDDIFPDPATDSWDVFLQEYRRIRKDFHQKSRLSRTDIWQEVYLSLGVKPDIPRLTDWETEYWNTVKKNTHPFPETITVLDQLSPNYKLALITNTQGQKSGGTHRLALFPDLEKFFQAIVVAGEDGVPTKPDPKPFELCMEKLGIVPSEAVYVGDDWRIDVGGAERAGMHPVWLKHHTVKRSWPEVDASAPVITSLTPLLDLDNLLS